MKTLFKNITVFTLFMMGMLAVSSSVSADTRNNTRTATTTNTGGRRTVSEPKKDNNKANVANQNNNGATTARPGGNAGANNNKGNLNRPTTNNTGNYSANNWPSEGKPNVNSNHNYNTSRPADEKKDDKKKDDKNDNHKGNATTKPSDLRVGQNGRPSVSGNGFHIGGNNHPDNKPGFGHGAITNKPSSWKTPVAPPKRTYRPADYKVNHVTRPNGYRPIAGSPIISGIFGLPFGSSIYHSLDYLFDRGYEIDGFYNDVVYLRNVKELGFFWPDAIIRYDNFDRMKSAELHYSTSYNSTSRYNKILKELRRIYGKPYTYKTAKGERKTIWYGSDFRGYITLEYHRIDNRYYTTVVYSF